MRRSSFKAPCVVLIFNGARKLVSITRSLHVAAEMTFCNLQAISFCCTGKYVQSCGYYFRHLDPRVLVEIEDLDSLTVEEYDRLCGESRKYYSIRMMHGKKIRMEQKRRIKVMEQRRRARAWLAEFRSGKTNKR